MHHILPNALHSRSLHLELLNTIRQPLLLISRNIILLNLARQPPLPKLPPRQLDRLLDPRLLQLRQPLLLVPYALLLHLAQKPLPPFQKRLRRDGRAVEFLVLLALGGEGGLLGDFGLCVAAVLDELLGGLFQGGVEREDHGHAEVLLDGVGEVGEQRVAVVADVEVQVHGGIGRGEDVEVRRGVGIFVGVADGEEEAGRFIVGVVGGFFAGDVEDDVYPEFGLGDVCGRYD